MAEKTEKEQRLITEALLLAKEIRLAFVLTPGFLDAVEDVEQEEERRRRGNSLKQPLIRDIPGGPLIREE